MTWVKASDGQFVNLDNAWRIVDENDALAHVFPALPGNPPQKIQGEAAVKELRKAIKADKSSMPTRRGAHPGKTSRLKEGAK